MAASPKKSSKKVFKLPSEWANLEDIFNWVTVKGFEKPTDDESRKLWLVAYEPGENRHEKLKKAAKELSGIESIVFSTMNDGVCLALFTFKSQRTIKYIRENKLVSGYLHANFVRTGKKREFILHLIRGGCVVIPEDDDVVLAKPGSTKKGWKVELCENVQNVVCTDHHFVRGEVAEESEEEEVEKSDPSSDDE